MPRKTEAGPSCRRRKVPCLPALWELQICPKETFPRDFSSPDLSRDPRHG